MTESLPALRAGQTVELTFRSRDPLTGEPVDRTITARVNDAEQRDRDPLSQQPDSYVYFGYVPLGRYLISGMENRLWRPENYRAGAWGRARLYPTPKPFGLQAARILRDA